MAAVAEVMEPTLTEPNSGPNPSADKNPNASTASNSKTGVRGARGRTNAETGRKKKPSFREGEGSNTRRRRPYDGEGQDGGGEKEDSNEEVDGRISAIDHDLPDGGRPPARSGARPTRKSSRRKTGSKRSDRKTSSGAGLEREVTSTLENELEQEMRYRDTIRWSVGVLQQSVDDLEKQLEEIESGDAPEEEFKLRYDAQLELNDKLEEQTKWYKEELESSRERMNKALRRSVTNLTTMCQEFSYDQGLDDYTEFELAHMVKLLERERNSLYGDLRNKSWLLDNQSKEYYHLKELIKAYSGDLTIVNRSLEKIWRQQHNSGFAGGSTPVLSPGSLRWISETGINPSQRIIDPRKGPIRKTVGVRSLPRLDKEALDDLEASSGGWRYGMSRSRSRGRRKTRAKSLDVKKSRSDNSAISPMNAPAQSPKTDESHLTSTSNGFVRMSASSKHFDKSDGFIKFHSGGSVESFIKKDNSMPSDEQGQPHVEDNNWMGGGSKCDSGVATMEKGRSRRSEDMKTSVRMTRRPREDPPMLFRREPRGKTKRAPGGETKRTPRGETRRTHRGSATEKKRESRQVSRDRKAKLEEEREQFAQSVNDALLRSNLEFTQSRSGKENMKQNDGHLTPNEKNERTFSSARHNESPEVANKVASDEDADHGFSESQGNTHSDLRDGEEEHIGDVTRNKETGSNGGANDDGFADGHELRGGDRQSFEETTSTKMEELFTQEETKGKSELVLPEGKAPSEDYGNEPRSSGDSQRSSSGVFDDYEASTTASIELNSEDMVMETLDPNKV